MPKVPYDSDAAKFSVDVWPTADSDAMAVGYDSLADAKADYDKIVASGVAYWVELNEWTGDADSDGWQLISEWPGDDADDEEDEDF